jgi:hypothetical protein
LYPPQSTHPTSLPQHALLFFQFEDVYYKAASLHNEDTLRAGVEQAAFFYADVLFGSGLLTPTTLLTLNRVSQFPHHDLPEAMRDPSRPLRLALHAQQQKLQHACSHNQGLSTSHGDRDGDDGKNGSSDAIGSGRDMADTWDSRKGAGEASSPFQRKDFLDLSPDLEAQISSLRCWHSRVVQASAAIDGVPLDKVVAAQNWPSLDHRSLSAAVAFQLLATASDAKGDNVLVTATGQLVGIDNDHALGMPYSRRPDGTLRVTLRSLLLCCPTILAMPVHEAIADRLAHIVPEAVLLTWLDKLAAVNGRCLARRKLNPLFCYPDTFLTRSLCPGPKTSLAQSLG